MKTFKQFQEGLVTKLLIGGALATPFLMKKFLKPKTDKAIDKGRKTLDFGGDKRSGVKEGVFADPKLNKKYPNQPKMTEKGKKILPTLPDPEGMGSKKTKKGKPITKETETLFNQRGNIILTGQWEKIAEKTKEIRKQIEKDYR